MVVPNDLDCTAPQPTGVCSTASTSFVAFPSALVLQSLSWQANARWGPTSRLCKPTGCSHETAKCDGERARPRLEADGTIRALPFLETALSGFENPRVPLEAIEPSTMPARTPGSVFAD